MHLDDGRGGRARLHMCGFSPLTLCVFNLRVSSVGIGAVDCPTQLTPIFILWYLYLSVVFRDKYQSYKYEKNDRPGDDCTLRSV